MATETDRIKHRIDAARRELAEDVEKLGVQRRAEEVRGWLRTAKDRVVGVAESVTPDRVAKATKDSPIGVGLIAVGAGLVAAALIPETEAERKVARHLSDELGEPIQEAGRTFAADVRTAVASAASEVGTAAAHAASEVGSAARIGATDVRQATAESVHDAQAAS